MENEEVTDADPRDTRRTLHIGGPYGALLRAVGSLLSRGDTRQVEHMIAVAGRDCGLQGRMEELGIPVPPPAFRGGIIASVATEEALAERLYEAWRAEYAKASPSQATWAQLRGHPPIQEEVNGWLSVARLVLRGGS